MEFEAKFVADLLYDLENININGVPLKRRDDIKSIHEKKGLDCGIIFSYKNLFFEVKRTLARSATEDTGLYFVHIWLADSEDYQFDTRVDICTLRRNFFNPPINWTTSEHEDSYALVSQVKDVLALMAFTRDTPVTVTFTETQTSLINDFLKEDYQL